MSARTFEARGSVRGACGHVHKTPTTAQKCADGDGRSVRRGYPSRSPHGMAYSDRVVHVLSPGDGPEGLTEDELDELSRG